MNDRVKNQTRALHSISNRNRITNITVNIHYNICLKGHFESEWREIYTPMSGYVLGEVKGDYYVVSYEGNYSSVAGLVLHYAGGRLSEVFPRGAQVDFQVQVLIGYIHHVVPGSSYGGLFFGGGF
jgi:hypothetical protein